MKPKTERKPATNKTASGSPVAHQRWVSRFPSPACDRSGRVWPDEIKVIEQMLGGENLVSSRNYIADGDTYAVSWYWESTNGKYPNQYDVPVMRLGTCEMLRKAAESGGGIPAIYHPWHNAEPWHEADEKWTITNTVKRVTVTLELRGQTLTHTDETVLNSKTNRWKLRAEWQKD